MSVQISPYLNFDGDAREAIELYGSVFGAEPAIDTFDSVGPVDDPATAKKVMHSQVEVPGVGTVMASDVPPGTPAPPHGTIALSGGQEEREQLHAWFAALSDGARDVMGIETAPWGDEFGMVTDRFGTVWMVNVAGAPAT
ncbi:VOC family protein [Cellulosimicrobium arenosum]|uniref:VOC family protein n=1 Tax=Cellulosimicrobium arenosum TaxID=2708133 RepID=A0A927J0F4_9MICO|nr:VOC family protein [Cellulosimicrobium arenosum]MBD8079583.1 VOC family protein [Cellulosimicrobium arenosum]